jgi:hypothetical protein
MTDDRLTAILVERIMGWSVFPNRIMTGGRSWLPRWRFQPTKKLRDAVRLLQRLAPQESAMGAAENGGFWARVRVGGATGEARDSSQARALSLALARVIGIEVEDPA